MPNARVIVLVIDSGGVGAAPDAGDFHDGPDVNTLANTSRTAGGLTLPTLASLGLGNITAIEGVPPASTPRASWARLRESSNGKDSVTGHWEMMNIVVRHAFPTYPDGFPPEIVERFEAITGRKVLGNRVASGTQIIEELGRLHLKTGRPILYTSADSVF